MELVFFLAQNIFVCQYYIKLLTFSYLRKTWLHVNCTETVFYDLRIFPSNLGQNDKTMQHNQSSSFRINIIWKIHTSILGKQIVYHFV